MYNSTETMFPRYLVFLSTSALLFMVNSVAQVRGDFRIVSRLRVRTELYLLRVEGGLYSTCCTWWYDVLVTIGLDDSAMCEHGREILSRGVRAEVNVLWVVTSSSAQRAKI